MKETKNYNLWFEQANDYVYFEHDKEGDNDAGGMWFNNKELVDYDGVFELPKEVIEYMEKEGYNMDYAKDLDE